MNYHIIWIVRKNKEEKGQYFALAIGFCIVSGAYGAGAISGGAFNPAVAVGLDLTSASVASVLGFPWGPWWF